MNLVKKKEEKLQKAVFFINYDDGEESRVGYRERNKTRNYYKQATLVFFSSHFDTRTRMNKQEELK